MPPVELYINEFDHFSHSHTTKTIYAKIENTSRAENWFKLLTMQMGIKVKDFVPHITIAKNILEGIEKEDPQLALSIRNLMFTFEDLLTVPEAGIRELLGQMDKKTLATALRGASEELKSYIFKSMSSRAVEMLKEDMEVLGPVKTREIHKAQLEAVAVARKLEAEGKITLTQETEDEFVS